MIVSRETSMVALESFKEAVGGSLSYKIKIEDVSVLPFLLGCVPGSCLVVSDNDFLSVFAVLSRSSLPFFSVLTNFDDDSPSGFVSPLKRAVDSFIINKSNPRGLVLVNRSCFEGVYPYHYEGSVFSVNNMVEYDALQGGIVDAGMIRVSLVVSAGSFSLRGSVVDFFPSEASKPIRVDFSYDSPRLFSFDVLTQLTLEEIFTFSFVVKVSDYDNIKTQDLLRGVRVFVFRSPFILFGSGNKQIDITLCPFESYGGSKSFPTRLLHSTGVSLNNKLFVPPWFVSKKKLGVVSSGNSFLLEKNNFDNLERGDLLVHEEFGFCLFCGIVEHDDGNESSVLLEFRDAKISLPVSRLFLLSVCPHPSPFSKISNISKKGLWQKRVSSVSKKIDSFVVSLFNQHVSRLKTNIRRSPVDSALLSQFVSSFKYIDTPDQSSAFNSILSDLSSSFPMDRLLCGDVGFGKTEVAIRATFCVVMQGSRVVVLAPTTILCYQLFDSFSQRLLPFAVNTKMVSRLTSLEKTKQNIVDFNRGSVDVLVCTHRIFSHLDDLALVGMLVVDEEHRFGVKQKELFVEKFPLIDLLYMSATPIPRSLQNALSGIKTISTISTPPINRLPIETVIGFFDINKISNYVAYEADRGGQIYFLHNNIQSIKKIVRLISDSCPGILVEEIHGKMRPGDIEKKLRRFVGGEFQVLVSTTIIESGLDIPNVNTIIINNAHLFGLSQLHQIRGRVGRHSRQAFAYLLIPRLLKLNVESKNRLKAIEENVALGSGYSLSTKDLELRGAGSVFGYDQSGGAKMGFDLYNKLLFRSISLQKGVSSLSLDDINVDVYGGRAFIPSSYVFEESLRLSIYQNVLALGSYKKLIKYRDNINNRFGVLPKSVSLLFYSQEIKIACSTSFVSSVVLCGGVVSVVFFPGTHISNVSVFLNWVSCFFKDFPGDHSYKRGAGNRLVLCFDSSFADKDIYVFLLKLLNKFRGQFL